MRSCSAFTGGSAMRLSHDVPCRFARLVFTIALAFTWAGGADRASGQVAPVASGSGETPDTKVAIDRLERCMRAIEAVRRDVPRETWDVEAVAASAGDDPAALLAWVRDHTIWVPYRGALRGPLGVLMDRRGNSLDRATLLAEFLRTRGKSVRLARTELSEAAARELQKQISFTLKAPPEQPGPTGRKVIDELQRKYAEPFGIQPANLGRAAEDLVTRSERLSEEIAQRTAEQ